MFLYIYIYYSKNTKHHCNQNNDITKLDESQSLLEIYELGKVKIIKQKYRKTKPKTIYEVMH